MLTLLDDQQTTDRTVDPPTRAISDSGAFADVGPDDSVRVFSARQELIFEYDPQTGRTRLHVPTGDLELVAAQGDIRLLAGGSVRMHGQSVLITATQSMKLGLQATVAKFRSMMSFDRRKVRLESESLELTAKTAHSKVDSSVHEGTRCQTTVRDITVDCKRIETNAESIVENSGSVFRTVTDLLQLTTGRMKSIVQSIYHVRCGTAVMKADDDFKIDGDQIHLG